MRPGCWCCGSGVDVVRVVSGEITGMSSLPSFEMTLRTCCGGAGTRLELCGTSKCRDEVGDRC